MSNIWHTITDKDIENIPKQILFKNSLDNKIQAVCQEVLREAAARQDGYKNDEVAIIIDINGNILGKFYGYNGVIKTDSEEYLDITLLAPSRSLILIHNHPNNSTLSYNDIIEMMADISFLGVVAVGNDGRVSSAYKIYKNDGLYSKRAININTRCFKYANQFKDKADMYYKIKEDVRRYILKHPENFGLLVRNSNHRR